MNTMCSAAAVVLFALASGVLQAAHASPQELPRTPKQLEGNTELGPRRLLPGGGGAGRGLMSVGKLAVTSNTPQAASAATSAAVATPRLLPGGGSIGGRSSTIAKEGRRLMGSAVTSDNALQAAGSAAASAAVATPRLLPGGGSIGGRSTTTVKEGRRLAAK